MCAVVKADAYGHGAVECSRAREAEGASWLGVTSLDEAIPLREAGIDEVQFARICGPIGLDIGARTPEETAISIAAELIATRSGRSGGRLRDGTLPIHDNAATPAPERTVESPRVAR